MSRFIALLVGVILVALLAWVISREDRPQANRVQTAEEQSDSAVSDVGESLSQHPGRSVGKIGDEGNSEPSRREIPRLIADRDRVLQLEIEKKEWVKDRGVLDVRMDYSDYLSYDDEQLRNLADQGDRAAQLLLGVRLSIRAPEQAKHYFRQAAVRGYTTTLINIADLNMRTVREYQSQPGDDNRALANESLVEAAAWALVAEIRGDPSGTHRFDQYSQDFELTEEITNKVCERAEDYYLSLQSDRESLGLMEFDDSPPPMLSAPFTRGAMCPSWAFVQPTCKRVEYDIEGVSGGFFDCEYAK